MHTESVELSASQLFSMASKIMFQASGGFYNTGAFQRTFNQGHRMRRKKVRNENEARLKSKDFLNFQVWGVLLMFFEVFFTLKVSS